MSFDENSLRAEARTLHSPYGMVSLESRPIHEDGAKCVAPQVPSCLDSYDLSSVHHSPSVEQLDDEHHER